MGLSHETDDWPQKSRQEITQLVALCQNQYLIFLQDTHKGEYFSFERVTYWTNWLRYLFEISWPTLESNIQKLFITVPEINSSHPHTKFFFSLPHNPNFYWMWNKSSKTEKRAFTWVDQIQFGFLRSKQHSAPILVAASQFSKNVIRNWLTVRWCFDFYCFWEEREKTRWPKYNLSGFFGKVF